MINNDELLFAVDDNNSPIEPVARKDAHERGIWHRNAHIWIYNSRKEILCHKRSRLKASSPGKWEAFFGGHAGPGVEMADAAAVELKEESGIGANKDDLQFLRIQKYSHGTNNEFLYIYLYKWDGEINSLQLEQEEVEEVKWVPLDMLEQKLLNKNPNWTLASHALITIETLKQV